MVDTLGSEWDERGFWYFHWLDLLETPPLNLQTYMQYKKKYLDKDNVSSLSAEGNPFASLGEEYQGEKKRAVRARGPSWSPSVPTGTALAWLRSTAGLRLDMTEAGASTHGKRTLPAYKPLTVSEMAIFHQLPWKELPPAALHQVQKQIGHVPAVQCVSRVTARLFDMGAGSHEAAPFAVSYIRTLEGEEDSLQAALDRRNARRGSNDLRLRSDVSEIVTLRRRELLTPASLGVSAVYRAWVWMESTVSMVCTTSSTSACFA